MDFISECKRVGVAEVVRVLGCPERTVYSWVMGDRLPAEWVQRLVLARLKRTRPTTGQTNKAARKFEAVRTSGRAALLVIPTVSQEPIKSRCAGIKIE